MSRVGLHVCPLVTNYCNFHNDNYISDNLSIGLCQDQPYVGMAIMHKISDFSLQVCVSCEFSKSVCVKHVHSNSAKLGKVNGHAGSTCFTKIHMLLCEFTRPNQMRQASSHLNVEKLDHIFISVKLYVFTSLSITTLI